MTVAARLTRPLLSIVVHGIPASKGSMRCIGSGGRHQLIPDNRPALKSWTGQIVRIAGLWLAKGGQQVTGPVEVTVTFTVPRPKSVNPATRPWPERRGLDLDKAVRALLDALQPTVIADDAQVVRLTATKTYPDTPNCPDRLDQPGAVIRLRRTE